MSNPLLSGKHADGRPRIHVWPGPAWSIGPMGRRQAAGTAGQAVDAALHHLDATEAVVIIEGTTR